MSKTPKKQMSMNEAFDELQGITEQFEKGDIELEDGIAKFKRGLELAKLLKTKISKIENEIEEVKSEFDSFEDVDPQDSKDTDPKSVEDSESGQLVKELPF